MRLHRGEARVEVVAGEVEVDALRRRLVLRDGLGLRAEVLQRLGGVVGEEEGRAGSADGSLVHGVLLSL